MTRACEKYNLTMFSWESIPLFEIGHCKYCGSKNSNEFCNLNCKRYLKNKINKFTRPWPIKKCLNCDKFFPLVHKPNCGKPTVVDKSKKFCSQSCSATFSNSNKFPKFKIKCKNCKQDIGKYKSASSKFCNVSCMRQFKSLEKTAKINVWLTGGCGKEAGKSSGKIKSDYRVAFLKSKKYTCEDCGFTGENRRTGASIIQVDHVNGDSSDNRVGNLRALCPNCHAMTETFCLVPKELKHNSKTSEERRRRNLLKGDLG